MVFRAGSILVPAKAGSGASTTHSPAGGTGRGGGTLKQARGGPLSHHQAMLPLRRKSTRKPGKFVPKNRGFMELDRPCRPSVWR